MQRVLEFLDKEVPYTGNKAWDDWQEECNRLGPQAPAVFLETLKSGPEHTHYASLLGLRIFGYEAWGEGDGAKRIYRIRQSDSGDWTVIDPIHKPPDFNDPENWQEIGRGT